MIHVHAAAGKDSRTAAEIRMFPSYVSLFLEPTLKTPLILVHISLLFELLTPPALLFGLILIYFPFSFFPSLPWSSHRN